MYAHVFIRKSMIVMNQTVFITCVIIIDTC